MRFLNIKKKKKSDNYEIKSNGPYVAVDIGVILKRNKETKEVENKNKRDESERNDDSQQIRQACNFFQRKSLRLGEAWTSNRLNQTKPNQNPKLN